MRTAPVVLTAALSLALAGCMDDVDPVEDRQGNPGSVPETLDVEDTATATEGGTTVEVEALEFPDAPVSVRAGEPITFVNRDSVAHTVTSGVPEDSEAEDTGVFDTNLPAGESASIVVEDPGTYFYFCAIHQQMRGRLRVEPI